MAMLMSPRFLSVTLLACLCSLACGPSKAGHGTPVDPIELGEELEVQVKVDVEARGATVPAAAFGMHASVYDNALHATDVPELLRSAGIALLRWPGGGYSDNYHFSTHKMTPWPPAMPGGRANAGYLAKGTDFGGFTQVLASFGGQAMITVNYGSNLQGSGPGEPKEAAAWVAYANGAPDDTTLLGVDSAGNDWHSVGYWASLRASEPLAVDDGSNFLRIGRGPLGVVYWEIGNEVFGNGYYAEDNGFELDLHLPYDGTRRRSHENLSPTRYGQGVVEYAAAMKAVDPSIHVGAVLNTPPADYSWGPDWNGRVLAECGMVIDFAVVHWYPNGSEAQLLAGPRDQIPAIRAELDKSFASCCKKRSAPIEIAVTEIGPNAGTKFSTNQAQATGLFAAQGYAAFLAQGIFNVDWLELHNTTFLSERSADHRGPAYQGIQLAHFLVDPGDTFVGATSSYPHPLLAFAADRADGQVSLMLVNVAPKTRVTAHLEIRGASLGAPAKRYDYQPSSETTGGAVSGPAEASGGNAFDLVIPAYSATTIQLPKR
jgi:hypothetical protein